MAPSTLTFTIWSPSLARLIASMWLRLQLTSMSVSEDPKAQSADL
jgi:hypothetical protein